MKNKKIVIPPVTAFSGTFGSGMPVGIPIVADGSNLPDLDSVIYGKAVRDRGKQS